MQEEDYTFVTLDSDDAILTDAVIVDVDGENSLYGESRANLRLASRYDVDACLVQARSAQESLLSRMTGGVHLHTLHCPAADRSERIRQAPDEKGILSRKE